MRYGVCGGPDLAALAARAGFDFFETAVAGLLKPQEDEAAFRQALGAVKQLPIRCEAVNCFVPAELKITGPGADLPALTDYAACTCERAREAGVEVIVFGSGGARRIPDGVTRDRAHWQLAAFLRAVAPVADEHGVTVVVEPLHREACNVLNTVAECAALVREVRHPSIRLLVDSFHWGKDADSAEDIVTNGDLLAHVHVGTVANRKAPGAEDCDFGPFFRALKAGGYDGRISIEAGIDDPATDLPRALRLLKELTG